jgi:hypothetical protein
MYIDDQKRKVEGKVEDGKFKLTISVQNELLESVKENIVLQVVIDNQTSLVLNIYKKEVEVNEIILVEAANLIRKELQIFNESAKDDYRKSCEELKRNEIFYFRKYDGIKNNKKTNLTPVMIKSCINKEVEIKVKNGTLKIILEKSTDKQVIYINISTYYYGEIAHFRYNLIKEKFDKIKIHKENLYKLQINEIEYFMSELVHSKEFLRLKEINKYII